MRRIIRYAFVINIDEPRQIKMYESHGQPFDSLLSKLKSPISQQTIERTEEDQLDSTMK